MNSIIYSDGLSLLLLGQPQPSPPWDCHFGPTEREGAGPACHNRVASGASGCAGRDDNMGQLARGAEGALAEPTGPPIAHGCRSPQRFLCESRPKTEDTSGELGEIN